MLLTQHGCIQQGVWSISCHLDPETTEKAVGTKVFNKTSDHITCNRVAIHLVMAYSIHGHISYILETNYKRPIRGKDKK